MSVVCVRLCCAGRMCVCLLWYNSQLLIKIWVKTSRAREWKWTLYKYPHTRHRARLSFLYTVQLHMHTCSICTTQRKEQYAKQRRTRSEWGHERAEHDNLVTREPSCTAANASDSPLGSTVATIYRFHRQQHTSSSSTIESVAWCRCDYTRALGVCVFNKRSAKRC